MNKWISVEDLINMERCDFICAEPEDVERYGQVVLVFDEDMGEVVRGSYDFRDKVWECPDNGHKLHGVTHWQPLPDDPFIEMTYRGKVAGE